jgi:DNA invertase Pin-like site-specific DNA recombinase
VSGKSQDLPAQLADLKAAGCTRIFREKMSAATAERPQLKKLLALAGDGDVIRNVRSWMVELAGVAYELAHCASRPRKS